MKNVRLFIELIYILVKKELKVRYKSSVLGYFWALLNPLAFALVYYFAFKIIMRVQMPNYSVFLIAGMFPWVWMTNSLVHATATYKNNASLVKNVNFNKSILPISHVAHEMIHFFLATPVLMLFIFYSQDSLYLSWIWQIPTMILIQMLLVSPIALLLAIGNVFVHDIEYVVGIILSLLFFVTPIVYPISMVPTNYHKYFEYNPIVKIIENWRSVFLHGELDLMSLIYPLGIAIVMFFIAIYLYRKTYSKFGELL